MDKQSVRIGVDRFFYAPLLTDTNEGATYGASVALPGITEVGVTLNSSVETFYADDGPFETMVSEGDKEVSVSLAGLSQEVRAILTGSSYSEANGLSKDGKTDMPPNVAIGFRSQKANGEYRYVWIYKGKFSKSDSTSSTKSGSASPQVEQYTYKATLRICDGNWRQMLDSDDANCPTGLNNAALNDEVTGWFSSPNYVPVAPGTPVADLAATTGMSAGEIDLTFSAPTGMISAKVQVQDSALGVWVDATTSTAITAASTSATITGVTAGNTYNCRLVVVGGAKNGISNMVSASAGA